MLALGVVLLAAMVIWAVFIISKESSRGASVALWNLGVAVVAIIVFRFMAPAASNALFYRGVVEHLGYAIVVTGAAVVCLTIYLAPRKRRYGNEVSMLYGVAAAVFAIVACVLIYAAKESVIAGAYKFPKREAPISMNTAAPRFTPLEVAYQAMRQKFSESLYDISEEHVHPVDWDGGFGYVGPVIPTGFLNPLLRKSDGFVVYDDNPGVADTDRVKRIREPLKVGLGMMVLDNLERVLYDHDWWAEYPDIYYLQLQRTNRNELTAVAPKIKYTLSLPWLAPIPFWAGVVLVDKDGTIEDLTVEKAKADPRLQGKMIFPVDLARKMVAAQRFDEGLISGFIKREGKIEIPKLPGKNQMPYMVKGDDGSTYFMVSAEPDGDKTAIYRKYYVDATSGARSYYQFDPDKGLIGPATSMRQVESIQGYKWVDSSGHGNFRIVESVPIERKGRHFWKWTVTTDAMVGVVLTTIVDAHSEELLQFRTRAEFMQWLTGRDVTAGAVTSAQGEDWREREISAIAAQLRELTKRLEALRAKTPSAPKR